MSNKKPSIFLVEDEPSLIHLYKIVFEKDYHFFVSENYELAMKFLSQHKPDVILLDIIIPAKENSNLDYTEKVGFNILREVKNKKELQDIPVVVLTNLNSPEDRKISQELGAVDFVVKANILPKELLARVSKILKS